MRDRIGINDDLLLSQLQLVSGLSGASRIGKSSLTILKDAVGVGAASQPYERCRYALFMVDLLWFPP